MFVVSSKFIGFPLTLVVSSKFIQFPVTLVVSSKLIQFPVTLVVNSILIGFPLTLVVSLIFIRAEVLIPYSKPLKQVLLAEFLTFLTKQACCFRFKLVEILPIAIRVYFLLN